jgi:hypothetical protein
MGWPVTCPRTIGATAGRNTKVIVDDVDSRKAITRQKVNAGRHALSLGKKPGGYWSSYRSIVEALNNTEYLFCLFVRKNSPYTQIARSVNGLS